MPNENIPTWRRDPSKRGSLAPLGGSKYPLVDAHLHAVNFVQETPGGEALIEAMDRAGVRKAVIFGLPVAKIWAEFDREHPDYYLANDARCYYYGYTDVLVAELVRSLPAEQQGRLYPLMCGFNPTDKYALRDVERLYAQYPEVWSGIGELLLRHDDLTALTYGDAARANHRALWPIYQFATDHDLPVLMHQNVTAVSKSDHPVYLYELEEALRDFPRTRFILAHCGMSRRVNVPFYHKMVERLLDQYPLLVVDYSWIIYDVSICPGSVPQEGWIELTEKYSERICLGSDLVTKFEKLGPELQRYDVFLDQLSEEVCENVCWKTAERVYGGNKGKVS
jgi:predicted TIM-barrel fold metal-dependent hydrolase